VVQASPTLCHVQGHPGEPLLPASGTVEVVGCHLGLTGDAGVHRPFAEEALRIGGHRGEVVQEALGLRHGGYVAVDPVIRPEHQDTAEGLQLRDDLGRARHETLLRRWDTGRADM
jgi:hypothetical protein